MVKNAGSRVRLLCVHAHDLSYCRLNNRCDVNGPACARMGTHYRCAEGCDWDICRPCFEAAEARR